MSIYQRHGITFAAFDPTTALPYAIENRTKHRIRVAQKCVDLEFWTDVAPTTTAGFAWDNPSGNRTLLIEYGLGEEFPPHALEVPLDDCINKPGIKVQRRACSC